MFENTKRQKITLKLACSRSKVLTFEIITAYFEEPRKILNNVDEIYEILSSILLEKFNGIKNIFLVGRSIASCMNVTLTEYTPLSGKTCMKLPKAIAKKMAVVNMKNDDKECFEWYVARLTNHVAKNSERVTKELRAQSTKFKWFELPMKVDNVSKWEMFILE